MERCFVAILQLHPERMVAGKSCYAMNHADSRALFDNGLILGLSQFLNASLLLYLQYSPIYMGPLCGDTMIERTGSAMMCNLGGADQDLGRHTAHVDAGTSRSTPLHHRHLRPFVPQTDCGCKCCGPAANHGDLKRV